MFASSKMEFSEEDFVAEFQTPIELDKSAYWRVALKDLTPLSLKTIDSLPERKFAPLDTVNFVIEKNIVDNVREQSMLDAALLASIYTLMYRYSDQTDFAGLVSISNEPKAEKKEASIPLRVQLKKDVTLRTIAELITKNANEAYRLLLPLEKIYPDITLMGTEVSHAFNVRLMLQASSIGINVESGLSDPSYTQFKYFNIQIEEVKGTLQGSIQFKPALFPREHIVFMTQHLKNIFMGFYKAPTTKISHLEFKSPDEIKLLNELNNTQLENKEPDKLFDELFSEKAKKFPNEIAWVYHPEIGESQKMTYAEAEKQSNELASYLIRVNSSTFPVGFCCRRGLNALVGTFAIFKAGSIYVPISPSVSAIEKMLRKAGDTMEAILVDDSTIGLFKQVNPALLKDLHYINMDHLEDSVYSYQAKQHRLPYNRPTKKEITPDNLATMFATSGTTGESKIVENTRAGLINLALGQSKRKMRPDGKVLTVAPATFDAYLFDLIIFSVCKGPSQLHMPFQEGSQSPDYLAKLIIKEQLSFLTLTPYVIKGLMEADLKSKIKLETVVEWIITMGAKALPEIMSYFLGIISNELGHTEASICGVAPRPGEEKQKLDEPPSSVYKPLCNSMMLILDSNFRICPIGKPGRLYVSGPGLAHSYTRDKIQTEKSFFVLKFDKEKQCFYKPLASESKESIFVVNDDSSNQSSSRKRKLRHSDSGTPAKKRREEHSQQINLYDTEDGLRVYDTGDEAGVYVYEREIKDKGSVKKIKEARVSFIGRHNNRQIKIDGARVEIDGIEATLKTIKGVKEVTVLQHPKNEQLFAYFTKIEPSIEIFTVDFNACLQRNADLRNARLRHAFALDKIPLTTNAKVDTAALLACKIDTSEIKQPTTKLQSQIRHIWAKAIHIDEKDENTLGINEGFAQMGGKSFYLLSLANDLIDFFKLPKSVRVMDLFPQRIDTTITDQTDIILNLQKEEELLKSQLPLDSEGDIVMLTSTATSRFTLLTPKREPTSPPSSPPKLEEIKPTFFIKR